MCYDAKLHSLIFLYQILMRYEQRMNGKPCTHAQYILNQMSLNKLLKCQLFMSFMGKLLAGNEPYVLISL